jgi:pyrroline-5-carboxylate reductase
MAAAMARGWAGSGDRLLFADVDADKARKLAGELGGEAVDSNAELAERADVVVLAVKPGALAEAASELSGAGAVISILGATPLERVEASFHDAEVGRIMPNLAVEVGGGVLCISGKFGAEVRGRLDALGYVVELPDSQFDVATALMGCSPAYFALVAEALVDAGVGAGLEVELAEKLVVEAAAGTGTLMRVRRPADLRISVTSPGGSTEAGLEALEREGAREAFGAAVRASLERMRG